MKKFFLLLCLVLAQTCVTRAVYGEAPVADSPPVNVSVGLASGSSATGVARAVSSRCSDADGTADITSESIKIATGDSASGSLYGYYDHSANKLYLYNDAGTTLTGGFAPGSANVITNSQGSLNCATTTVISSDSYLLIYWSFTPSASFFGTKNIYLTATDTAGASSDWQNLNTWTITAAVTDNAPVNVSVGLASGSSATGVARAVSSRCSDADGTADITSESIKIATGDSASGSLYGYYDHSANKLYLYNDAGTTLTGGFAPGSANVITNSQGSLNCATTTVISSDSYLLIYWSFTPSASFFGTKNIYLTATDTAGASSDWQNLNTWTITAAVTDNAPVNVSVGLASGSSATGVARAVSSRCSDADGTADITSESIKIATGDSASGSLYGYYDHSANKLYLYNDAGTTLTGGFAPGSANVITNSQGSLNCATTTVISSDSYLLIYWSFTPSASFFGTKNIYLTATDTAGASSDWQNLNTWTITAAVTDNPPVNVSVTPASGSSAIGTARTVATVTSDADGAADIGEVFLMVNSSLSFTKSGDLFYDVVHNLLYVRNDANTEWKGGFAPGSANTIDNGQVILNCAATTIIKDGNTVKVYWNITPKTGFSGSMNLYLHAYDLANAAAVWQSLGTWTITAQVTDSPPVNVSVAPSSGSGPIGTARTIATATSDADGAADIGEVFLMVNSSLTFTKSGDLFYDVVHNLLYVRNDANTEWKGGFAPGSANTIDNGQVILNCAATSVIKDGTTVNVYWNITPKTGFSGTMNLYLHAYDMANASAVWQSLGTWTITGANSAPLNVSVTPASGTSAIGTARTMATVTSDADSAADISQVFLMVNTSLTFTNSCDLRYDATQNLLYERNDANTEWKGGFAPGSANTIDNGQAILNCAATTVIKSGNTVKVYWNITPKSGFLGAMNLYLHAYDLSNASAVWQSLGTWTITAQAATQQAAPVNPSLRHF